MGFKQRPSKGAFCVLEATFWLPFFLPYNDLGGRESGIYY